MQRREILKGCLVAAAVPAWCLSAKGEKESLPAPVSTNFHLNCFTAHLEFDGGDAYLVAVDEESGQEVVRKKVLIPDGPQLGYQFVVDETDVIDVNLVAL